MVCLAPGGVHVVAGLVSCLRPSLAAGSGSGADAGVMSDADALRDAGAVPAARLLVPGVTIVECPASAVAGLRSAWVSGGVRSPQECVDDLDVTASRHWAAMAGGVPVGCASLAVDARVVAGVPASHRLRWLGVSPGWRGRGVGRALVAFRLGVALQDGAVFAWSDALVSAAGLYVAWGAVADDRVYDDDGTGPHVDVLYGPLPMRLNARPTSAA
jgi:GNAT superfamily N-acetyltransferase